MSRKTEHASIEEYTLDLRSDLAAWGKQELGGLEAVIQGSGYTWMEEYLGGILDNVASGSRLPVTELMKTPSRTHTIKKTRTITTAAKDRTNKINLANSRLLGSPVTKSTSARPPLSPLSGRHLNTAPKSAVNSPIKSPVSKAAPIIKVDKGKGKATTKKPRTKKAPTGENSVPDFGPSLNICPALPDQSASTSTHDVGLLGSSVAAVTRHASPTPTPPRPPRSPERAHSPAAIPTFSLIPATQEMEDVPMVEAPEVPESEEMMPEEEEEVVSDEKEEAAPSASASSRPRTVDLSIIAEAEEDRTSITIPQQEELSKSAQPAPVLAAPLPLPIAAQPPTTIESHSEPPASVSSAPAGVPIPAKQVRSSWLSKALSGSAPPTSAAASNRSSDGTNRTSIAPTALPRLSTAGYPTMRKSLVQPGQLAKRKSGDGIWDEDEGEKEGEKRAEKSARIESESTTAPVASSSASVDTKMEPPPATTVAAPVPAPVQPVTAPKPSFDRQHSQESFARAGPSNPTPSSFAVPAIDHTPKERPTSDMTRVSKALDEMRERQQAKDAAKQKAALSVSIATPASAPARSTGTGTGFLRGLGGLGSSLTRSLGLGSGYRDAEEEAKRAQEEKDEEEEVRRKAREDLSEVLRKVEEPENAQIEEIAKEDEGEMVMEMEEEEVPVAVVTIATVKNDKVNEVEEEDDDLDMLDTDEEDEVNESVEVDEVTSLLSSPVQQLPPLPPTISSIFQQPPIPFIQPQHASNTPCRLPRHGTQSTTPQGTPPRSRPATVIAGGSQRVLRSSPAQPQPQPQPTRAPRQLDGSIAPSAQNAVQDRIKLFNGPSSTAQSSKTSFLFSPTKSGNKKSDAIEIDFDDEDIQPQSKPMSKGVKAGSRPLSPEMSTQEEEMESATNTQPGSPVTMSRTTSATNLNASMFGMATTMANKALGVKPVVGQPKSVQLASSAYKKDLAASERRALTKEQRIKIAADRKAEEERKLKEKELEDRKARLIDQERRKKEAEERRIQIAKHKADKERKEREATEKAEAEAEALRKQKLASSQNKPAPMQPAKRVISASASQAAQLSLLSGLAKMKEPAKLTKPSAPLTSTHGSSKLVPSTFRTAPETPVNQMSHTTSIRLVSQPQPAQGSSSQATQADRKPLGPPTRPSAIRASNQAAAIRQSQAVASQHQHHPNSSTLGTHTTVLTQSRLALQNQLEAEAAELASEEIVLPDIASEYSDSGDETDDSPAFKRPQWAESPELRAALAAQAGKNPDELFGPIRPLLMDELFKAGGNKNKFRSRTSSGNWQRDGLKKEEEEEYARRMGFSSGKW